MLSDTGTLALVLPAVVATTPGNLALRQYLASRFHVDLIVSSHDPDRIFFSENTSIGEMLLVCRRWNDGSPKPPTRFVNLTRNPATPVEALDAAARVERVTLSPGGAAQRNEPLYRAVDRRRPRCPRRLERRQLSLALPRGRLPHPGGVLHGPCRR